MKKTFKHFSILASLVIFLGSCQNYLEDAYVNPNAPVSAEPELVLPSVTANMARGIQFDSRYSGKYIQNWVSTSSGDTWDRHGYVAGSDAAGEKWRTHYWNLGQNLKNMIRDGQATEKYDYVGVAYAIFAWSWLHLADYHGDVILKQALDPSRLTFDYDTQDQVYEHVKVMADSAIYWLNLALPKQSSSTLGIGDKYLYNGDISKWIRFSNGIKGKAFHRWINKSNYSADSVIKYVDLSLISPADDATIKFENGALSDGANFYGPRRNNMAGFRVSGYMLDLMNGKLFEGVVDPRLKYIFKASGDGKYRGLAPNKGESTSLPVEERTMNFWGFASTLAPAGGVDTGSRTYFKNAAPFPVLTYSDLQFMKAEAAFKKGDKSLATVAYKNGIDGNFSALTTQYTGYLPISAADKTTFLSNPFIVPTDPNTLQLSQIMMQKYIALWGHGFEETWVDMRKYKYDPNIYRGFVMVSSFTPDNFGKPAHRVRPRYNSEYIWNVEALKKIGGFDANYHTYETWFVNP